MKPTSKDRVKKVPTLYTRILAEGNGNYDIGYQRLMETCEQVKRDLRDMISELSEHRAGERFGRTPEVRELFRARYYMMQTSLKFMHGERTIVLLEKMEKLLEIYSNTDIKGLDKSRRRPRKGSVNCTKLLAKIRPTKHNLPSSEWRMK